MEINPADLKAVEQRSLKRVAKYKIFTKLTRDNITEGAKKAVESGDVALRPGLMEFLNKRKEDNVHIISVNWSRHFIHSCLKASGLEFSHANIHANELHGIDTKEPSSGKVCGDMVASDDKLRSFLKIRKGCECQAVFVGDSWGDLECLIAADVGICIRDEPMVDSQKMLAERLEHVGTKCEKLENMSGDGKGVVWARDFFEIGNWADRQGI